MALHSRTQIHIDLDKMVSDLTTDEVLKVGWPKNIRYPSDQGGEYVAAVAAQNEYGAPHKNIPARPFLAPAVANNKTKWLELIERGSKDVVHGDTNIESVLDRLGAVAAFDVAKAIEAVTSPPLAPVTIAARLAKLSKKKVTSTLTKPLVDTGYMLRSISYAVEKE